MTTTTIDRKSIQIVATTRYGMYLSRLATKPNLASFVAIDPGLTTGFAVFDGGFPLLCGQATTPNVDAMVEFLKTLGNPHTYVVENYFIYKSKASDHINSEVTTIRLIGCIETIAHLRAKPADVIFQTAAYAKGYATDRLLESVDLYQPGMPHANDALRHGIMYVTFGLTNAKQQEAKKAT